MGWGRDGVSIDSAVGGSMILIIDYLEIAAHRFAMLAMTGRNIEYRTPTNTIGTSRE
ncbi:MAG: hypothetical protein ACYS3N_01245 [Planctomycetota bacterium]|jgi:hypothetical protein